MSAMEPLLTEETHDLLRRAAAAGSASIECSLDLGRSVTRVALAADHWVAAGRSYPFLTSCKQRTIYYWTGAEFQPAARFTDSLIKLVPTEWGAPTFEIDGIKMLPTAQLSPYEDARRKVELIRPRGKVILDTCGGLGYFAACALESSAAQVHSYEKNADVIWLRTLNPWSPQPNSHLRLENADVVEVIDALENASFDAVLHDPPRFRLAGELYSQGFYEQLWRVLKPRGWLFHYTGSPNKLTTGRDLPREVSYRLGHVGFDVEIQGDGLLARKLPGPR